MVSKIYWDTFIVKYRVIYKLVVINLQEAFTKVSHTPTNSKSVFGQCSFELPKYPE